MILIQGDGKYLGDIAPPNIKLRYGEVARIPCRPSPFGERGAHDDACKPEPIPCVAVRLERRTCYPLGEDFPGKSSDVLVLVSGHEFLERIL